MSTELIKSRIEYYKDAMGAAKRLFLYSNTNIPEDIINYSVSKIIQFEKELEEITDESYM